MIVVPRAGRLLLIRQLDHAAVAGRLAEAWGNVLFEAPHPLAPVALAASLHDEGWRERDDEVHFDSARKRPLNFLDADIHDYVELYARGIRRIADLDRYAGLLASMHGTGNVCGRWGTQRGVRLSGYEEATWPQVIERYVLEQEAYQARLKLALIGLNPEVRRSVFERRLWANYELLQAWDRLSLFLCRTDLGQPAEADLGEVPLTLMGPETCSVTARAPGNRTVRVAPWPFGSSQVDVTLELRRIPDRPYHTHDDAYSEVDRAPTEVLHWTLTKEAD